MAESPGWPVAQLKMELGTLEQCWNVKVLQRKKFSLRVPEEPDSIPQKEHLEEDTGAQHTYGLEGGEKGTGWRCS